MMVLMNDRMQLGNDEAATRGGVRDIDRGPMNLDGAVAEIGSLANRIETVDAAAALAAGRRQEMADLLLLVDGLRRVVASAESRVQASDSRPASRSAGEDPTGESREVARKASPPTRGHGRQSRSLTQFFRTQDELVKWGQVGTAKEYRHFVPLEVVSRVVAWIEAGPAANRLEFAFEDVRDHLADDGLKGYQMRIAIAWLRESKLIRMPARGRYFASQGMRADAEAALSNLPLESERNVAGKKGTRRKSKAAKKTKASGRSQWKGA